MNATTAPTGHRVVLRGDRGAVSAELVIATPVLLLMIMLIVQFALWSLATHIAQAATSYGLATTRAHQGTPAAGARITWQLLDQLADGPLREARVAVERGATTATVRISGTASTVVPFLRLPVHAEATGPVERFVPADGNG